MDYNQISVGLTSKIPIHDPIKDPRKFNADLLSGFFNFGIKP